MSKTETLPLKEAAEGFFRLWAVREESRKSFDSDPRFQVAFDYYKNHLVIALGLDPFDRMVNAQMYVDGGVPVTVKQYQQKILVLENHIALQNERLRKACDRLEQHGISEGVFA